MPRKKWMKPFLVFGSRTFENWGQFCREMDRLTRGFLGVYLITGDCPTGADKMAQEWAFRSLVDYEVHRADWERHKKAAGMIRNGEMVKAAGPKARAVAFKDNSPCKGTNDMIARCRRAGIKIKVIQEE